MSTQRQEKNVLYIPIVTMKTTDDIVEKLSLQRAKYTHQLIACGRTPQLRDMLAAQSGLSPALIAGLVSQADLMRLRGIGGDLSLLLVKAGVTSCRHLHQCLAEDIYKQVGRLHIGQGIAYHAPTLAQVHSWIKEAALFAETSPDV